MIDKLLELEEDIVELVQEKDKWTSHLLGINKAQAFVRVTRQWQKDYTIQIHKVWMSSVPIHPHPWPLAARLLKGEYRVTTYYPDGAQKLQLIQPGMIYEITSPDIKHSMEITKSPWYSLTLDGPVYSGKAKFGSWIKGTVIDDKYFDDIASVVLDYYN